LKVSVAVCKATLPTTDDEFIEYGEFEILEIPTKGRLAGFDPSTDSI
jgi:tyrosinase